MPKGYHHLTRDQRCQIYTLKKRGDSQSEIAREIGVHRSTVYRELKRNAGKRGYRFKQANRKASKRRRLASRRPKKLTPEALSLIGEKLKMQWSPEQIAGWLRKEDHPHAVSHELIYQLVWADKRAGGCLYKHLRHSGKKYNRRSSGRAGRGCIPHRVGIEERPKIVERKCRLGDWEADTIIGKGKKGAIVSVVDRASKLTKLAKVSRRTAVEVREALEIKLGPIKNSVFTLTSDNGKEFASHQQVAASLDADFYFARPYHSWERGLNEHTNGLVRQYIPKSTAFETVTEDQLEEIEKLLNNRPRKVLGFQTPIEAFEELSRRSMVVALQS